MRLGPGIVQTEGNPAAVIVGPLTTHCLKVTRAAEERNPLPHHPEAEAHSIGAVPDMMQDRSRADDPGLILN